MSRKPRPLRSVWRDVVAESGLARIARPTAYLLSTYMDGEGVCWPSRRTLAKALGRNVKTVDRDLRLAEAAGLLHVERSAGGRPDRRESKNTYVALCPATAPAKLLAEFRQGGSTVPPSERTGGKRRADRGEAQGGKGGSTLPPKSHEATGSGAPTAAAPLSGSASSAHEQEEFTPNDACFACGARPVVGPAFVYCAECTADLAALAAVGATR